MNSYQIQNGELAQLARALDLHSRGRGFDSHILHKFLTLTIIDILKIFISQTPVIQFVFVIIDTLQGINWFYQFVRRYELVFTNLYEHNNKYNFKEK